MSSFVSIPRLTLITQCLCKKSVCTLYFALTVIGVFLTNADFACGREFINASKFLHYFTSLLHYFTCRKCQKISSFLTYSESIEISHLREMEEAATRRCFEENGVLFSKFMVRFSQVSLFQKNSQNARIMIFLTQFYIYFYNEQVNPPFSMKINIPSSNKLNQNNLMSLVF